MPLKLFGIIKLFTVSVPYDIERFVTLKGEVVIPTVLTLNAPPEKVLEGQRVVFTGRLVRADTGAGVAGALIKIYDSDIEFDDLIAQGTTDSGGYFSIEWNAKCMDWFDRTVEVYAKFEGTEELGPSRSPSTGFYRIKIVPPTPVKTILILDAPPSEVKEGSIVTFTGKLVEAGTGRPVPGATIKIYDSDVGPDDLMASGVTDEEGRFSIKWRAKPMDPFDRTVEVYAKFEGTEEYQATRSPEEGHYTIEVRK